MTAEDVGRADAAAEAVALVGRQSGKSLRAIAVEIYGREQVDADWHVDSWMRVKLRRAGARASAGLVTE